MSPVRVSVGTVRDYPQRPGSPYRLGWALTAARQRAGAGRERRSFTATHADRGVLEDFAAALRAAAEAGQPFDETTGLPPGLSRPAPATPPPARPVARALPALYDVATRVHERWAGRVGNTVRSDIDALVTMFEAMVRADAPTLDDDQSRELRWWLREVLTPPTVRARLAEQATARREARRVSGELTPAQKARAARSDRARATRAAAAAEKARAWQAWYLQHGLRWAEVDEAAALRLIARLRVTTTGAQAAKNTVTRRFITASEHLDWAVRRRLLATNPFRAVEREDRPSMTVHIRPVELRRVVGVSTVVAIVNACHRLGRDGSPVAARLVAYLALLGLAGLRPEEARRLTVDSVHALPEDAARWGVIELVGSLPMPGRRYTATGERGHARGLKHHELQVRPVPIPPLLVAILRTHVHQFRLGGTDPLFLLNGKVLTPEQVSAVWASILHLLDGAVPDLPDELAPYDLRHARVSHVLATGEVDDATAAAMFGHTITTMRETYQGVITAGADLLHEDLDRFRDQIVPPSHRRPRGPAPTDLAAALAASGRLSALAATGQPITPDQMGAELAALTAALFTRTTSVPGPEGWGLDWATT